MYPMKTLKELFTKKVRIKLRCDNNMATMDENSNAVVQGIARHMNCLSEDNRNIRKKALEGIRCETVKRKPPLTSKDLKHIFGEIIKPLLKVLSDPVEKCRELATDTIREFLEKIEEPDSYLSYIVPVLVQRLGQQEITEPSEELRLRLVEITVKIVEISGKKIAAYLDDYIKFLARTIIDPYPEIKKESCKCAVLLAKSIPEYFHLQSEVLIKPLLLTITHQHSRVRAVVVETIGDVIQYGNGKSVDTVVSHLAQRLFDQAPTVRKAVIKVVGYWLLDLPDRYSFHYKLMPLLLTGYSDEQPEIQELADSLWNDIGLKYLKENEEELKDKIDFEKEIPSHYPPNVERPNLGCRTLMMRHVSKILPPLMKDLVDWVVATRIKSAGLLYVLLINAEDYVTQHMEILLNGLYKASVDEEVEVKKQIQKSATLIGYFVPTEIWCKLVLKSLRSGQIAGHVMVLANIIKGAQRPELLPYLSDICSTLLMEDVCQTIQTNMHAELMSCVESLISLLQEDVSCISQPLFNLLMTVMALKQDAETDQKVESLLDSLSKVQNLESTQELYGKHTQPLIQSFKDTFDMWTVHSVDRMIFETLLLHAGPVIGDHLDIIFPILITNFHPDKDPEMRLKFFSLLSKLVMNAANTVDSRKRFGDFAVTVVRDIILPNMVWKAGRTAGAIRTIAVSCLWALLQSGVLVVDKILPVVEDLLTQLISVVDDTNKSTRLIGCRTMTRVFELAGKSLELDRLHNMYPELLKRLDDSDDEIRITVATTFLAYLDSLEGRYDTSLYKLHLEAIYRGLLVHLDDPEPKIQQSILEVLKTAAKLSPYQLITEVENVKHKHRSTRYCDQLVQYTSELTKSSVS